MKKVALALGIALASAAPFSAFAQSTSVQDQVNALLAQINQLEQELQSLSAAQSTATGGSSASGSGTTPISTGAVCPSFSRTLMLGASGSDVANLQAFLAGQGLFDSPITGYFGMITQAGVRQWQSSHGVVSGGSATTTGWGAVGSATASAMSSSCGGASAESGASSCPTALPPTSMCSTGWQPVTNSYGCTTSYTCSYSLSPNGLSTSTAPLAPIVSCQSGYVAEGSECIPSACSAIALQCPSGEHDQVSSTCTHTCVPN